jgi:hypothetical protein
VDGVSPPATFRVEAEYGVEPRQPASSGLRPNDEQRVADAPADIGAPAEVTPDRQLEDEATLAHGEGRGLGEPPLERLEHDESASWIHSIGRETWIYNRPSYTARRLGYLRFGAKVKRGERVAGREGCPGGWYPIAPEGFVCANDRTATVDVTHPWAAITVAGPRREEPLPYDYAMARRGSPLFLRPARDAAETVSAGTPEISTLGLPAWLIDAPRIFGFSSLGEGGPRRLGLPGSGVAISASVLIRGTPRFGLTPTLELVDNTGLEPVKLSDFEGLRLGDGATLPVAFVKGNQAMRFTRDVHGAFRPKANLHFRDAVPLRGEGSFSVGSEWLQTLDGSWVRRDQMTIVPAPSELPSWVKDDLVWIDVSLSTQTLVAYEGSSPRYATLVSTGVDGVQDPKTSKATKQGVFRIVSKHLTATMDGEDDDHAYEMREVPWVQYFSEGYALHAAYWHDGFGKPRSHGCVNLSPRDARFLFHFTNPGVPRGWHGRTLSEERAVVYVHP